LRLIKKTSIPEIHSAPLLTNLIQGSKKKNGNNYSLRSITIHLDVRD